MPERPTSLAQETIDLATQLNSDRSTWDTLWQDISKYVMPAKSDILEEKTPDISGWTQNLHDITASQANMKLASGSFDYLVSGKWFLYEAPEEYRKQIGDNGKRWYKECSEIAQRELNRSNWDMEIHELFLDRGGFGTGGMFVLEGPGQQGLRFSNQAIGTYAILENEDKMVDTFIKTTSMTVRNMVKKYGYENCAKKVRECYDKGGKELSKTFEVIHRISPRDDVRAGPQRGDQKPWASIHVDKENKKLLQVSGFDEQAFIVSRFLRWGRHAYGYCPSVLALPITRSVNLLEKYMDALVEIAAFPRVLIPYTLDGNVDLRSSGVTLYDPNNPNAIPREWATEGRYDIGLDRGEKMREFINDAYHVALFEALADRTKQMTATEVLELKEEKLVNFSPTFARMRQEIFNPVLYRVFNILYRQGKFPDPPDEVRAILPNGATGIIIPEVALTSKLALAMKALENKNFVEFLAMAEMLFQIKPESVDWIKDDAVKLLSENAGVSVDFINTQEDVDKIRDARAKQQQAAAAAEAAKAAAGVAKDMSQANPQVVDAMAGAL